MKAIVARDLWNSSEFYDIFNGNDKEILKALEILNNPKRYEAILKGLEND
jgi:carboxyl-terminal processing protease